MASRGGGCYNGSPVGGSGLTARATDTQNYMAWWQVDAAASGLGVSCPGGANFKFAQTWPSGFRAVVQFGEWVPGRRVRLHYIGSDTSVPGFFRAVGATQLASPSARASLFELASLPGHLAPNAFDLQARGAPPNGGTSNFLVTCDLPYPPPPPRAPSPPAPEHHCAGTQLVVEDVWSGSATNSPGYRLRVTLGHRSSAAAYSQLVALKWERSATSIDEITSSEQLVSRVAADTEALVETHASSSAVDSGVWHASSEPAADGPDPFTSFDGATRALAEVAAGPKSFEQSTSSAEQAIESAAFADRGTSSKEVTLLQHPAGATVLELAGALGESTFDVDRACDVSTQDCRLILSVDDSAYAEPARTSSPIQRRPICGPVSTCRHTLLPCSQVPNLECCPNGVLYVRVSHWMQLCCAR